MTKVVLRMSVRMDGVRDRTHGLFVRHYDPTIKDDEFLLTCVDRIGDAKQFDSPEEAILYYRQVCPNIPQRLDGEPNRPLTAWCVEVVTVPVLH